MSDQIGSTLGSYKIIDELGHGGMANVYRAIQPSIGREVAIKVLPTNFLQDRTFLERFTLEVQVVARLQHPHILPVYDFGEQDGLPYIVMAYMRGGTLADRIHEAGNTMPLDEVARVVSQVAAGLDFAHEKGIIHRDLKPSNVLLDEAGNCYLSDFGIAKVTETSAHLTGSGVLGTPTYMAPEMANPGGVSPLIDIYALGVALFQMLTDRLPYEADTPMGMLVAHANKSIPDARELRPDLPDAVQRVIERAMAKNPKERYQTAGELAADLQAAVTGFIYKQVERVPPARGVPQQGSLMTDFDRGVRAGDSPASEVPTSELPFHSRWRIPTLAWVGAALAGLGLLCVAGFLLSGQWETLSSFLTSNTPVATAIPTTAAPVTPTPSATEPHNAAWTPVVQEFGGFEMVMVPPGCFMMGSTNEQIDAALRQCNRTLKDGCDLNWFTRETPQHQVCFERPFWIDRTEVTNEQYGSSGTWAAPNYPRESVTWLEADGFCKSRGARLPTEAEWEYAARGPDGLPYPWGGDFIKDYAVFEETSTQPADAGSIPEGASWVGAYDMSGNIWEWVSSWLLPYPYDPTDGRESAITDGASERVLRGGSWNFSAVNLTTTFRGAHTPDFRHSGFGFRCARDGQLSGD